MCFGLSVKSLISQINRSIKSTHAFCLPVSVVTHGDIDVRRGVWVKGAGLSGTQPGSTRLHHHTNFPS